MENLSELNNMKLLSHINMTSAFLNKTSKQEKDWTQSVFPKKFLEKILFSV